jgi:hypothetical protein
MDGWMDGWMEEGFFVLRFSESLQQINTAFPTSISLF